MTLRHLGERYHFSPADRVENYGGAINIYICWDGHLLFVGPLALPVDPAMPLRDLLENVVRPAYAQHPEAAAIEWERCDWELGSEAWSPDLGRSLADNGIEHMSFLRFRTPGLDGIGGRHI